MLIVESVRSDIVTAEPSKKVNNYNLIYYTKSSILERNHKKRHYI